MKLRWKCNNIMLNVMRDTRDAIVTFEIN